MGRNEAETLEELPDPVAELPAPQTGELLAERYRIGKLIARGGMGAVYEAEHVALGRSYAVKFLRNELAARSRSFARFEREAKLLAAMRHDNIAQVVDFGRYRERSPYLVMEYLEGRTLRRFIEENATRSIAFGIEVMRQTCRGVAHAHEHGIVHRDLKPDNLMLGNASDGSLRVKLLDFGIARRIMSVDTRLTPTGTELGTAHYMAPEQARGVKAVGPASDVYSLGVIFYELLTGERPHPGDTYNAVMFHLLTQPPLPLATVMPSCPEAVRDVVERCLAQRPDARYPTAKELLSALDELPEQPADGQPASVTESAVRTTKRNVLKPFLLGAGTGVAVSLLVVWLLSVGAGADAAIASGTAPRGEFGAATTTPLGAPRSEGPANEAAKITVEKHEPEESPGGLEPRRPPPASKAPLPRRLTSAAAPTARRGTVAPAPSSASAPSAVPRATAPVASSFGFVVRNPYD